MRETYGNVGLGACFGACRAGRGCIDIPPPFKIGKMLLDKTCATEVKI